MMFIVVLALVNFSTTMSFIFYIFIFAIPFSHNLILLNTLVSSKHREQRTFVYTLPYLVVVDFENLCQTCKLETYRRPARTISLCIFNSVKKDELFATGRLKITLYLFGISVDYHLKLPYHWRCSMKIV